MIGEPTNCPRGYIASNAPDMLARIDDDIAAGKKLDDGLITKGTNKVIVKAKPKKPRKTTAYNGIKSLSLIG